MSAGRINLRERLSEIPFPISKMLVAHRNKTRGKGLRYRNLNVSECGQVESGIPIFNFACRNFDIWPKERMVVYFKSFRNA